MRRIWVLCIILLCLSSLACSDDSSGANNANEDVLSDVSGADTNAGDAKDDVDPPMDAVAEDTRDDTADEDIADAVEDEDATDAVEDEDATDAVEEDAADAVEDIADAVEDEDTADAVEEDTADISAEDPYEGRPLGQCTQSSDCPESPMGATCSRALPGGACMGCGNDSHCPSNAECLFGNCVVECSSVDDCAPGLRCLGSGRCEAINCEDSSECPSLFVCGSLGQCERADCAADATICPDATTCISGRCIEDRAL